MRKLFLFIMIAVTTDAYCQVFKCVDEKKRVHYQDQPCTFQKGKLDSYQPTGQYQQRDPIDVKNEITTLENQVNANKYHSFNYHRTESNELIESENRKKRQRDESWKPYRIYP